MLTTSPPKPSNSSVSVVLFPVGFHVVINITIKTVMVKIHYLG